MAGQNVWTSFICLECPLRCTHMSYTCAWPYYQHIINIQHCLKLTFGWSVAVVQKHETVIMASTSDFTKSHSMLPRNLSVTCAYTGYVCFSHNDPDHKCSYSNHTVPLGIMRHTLRAPLMIHLLWWCGDVALQLYHQSIRATAALNRYHPSNSSINVK